MQENPPEVLKSASWTVAELAKQCRETEREYLEFLRVPRMSVGLYELAAGAEDTQRPHSEDEIYYVVRGRARFRAEGADGIDGEEKDVSPGTVIYVKAGVDHRFFDIEEDLSVLVVFAAS